MESHIESLKNQIEALVECKTMLGQDVDDLTRDLEDERMHSVKVEEKLSDSKVRLEKEFCESERIENELRQDLAHQEKVCDNCWKCW